MDETKPRWRTTQVCQKKVTKKGICNEIKLLFSGDGKGDSTTIKQNAEFLIGHLAEHKELSVSPDNSFPHGWVQNIHGSMEINGIALSKADGLAFENQDHPLSISAKEETHFFFFRLS